MALKDKYVVRLAAAQRRQLERLVSSGKRPARTLTRARILLKADPSPGAPGGGDARIAEALGCGARAVARVRKRFAAGGLDAALTSKKPAGRRYRKPDGAQEARLVALTCGPPPGGQGRWTLRRLAGRLAERAVVESIDPSTAWRALKKTTSRRG